MAPGVGSARVGGGFVALYMLAYTGFFLAALVPGLIAIPLKVNALAGDDAAGALGLVLGIGALLAMVATPVAGRLSDRTTSSWGMRRPWIVGGALASVLASAAVAAAPTIGTLLAAVCVLQVVVNAAGAALVGVLPDRVPPEQRGTVSGLLGVSLPLALVVGTGLVPLVSTRTTLMFMLPAGLGAVLMIVFAVTLTDRHLGMASKPAWSTRQMLLTFWVNPRRHPDFGWAFLSRFLVVLAYALLTSFQTFYLLNKLGTPEAEVPRQVATATLVLATLTVVASIAGGRLSDRTGRRKIFVGGAAAVYGVALVVVALAAGFNGFLVGMAVAGIGFGAYVAVDLALVSDVLPDPDNIAKDMAVFNIAGTLPQSIAPAVAPVVLAAASGSYTVLYLVAGLAAAAGALAIVPVRGVR